MKKLAFAAILLVCITVFYACKTKSKGMQSNVQSSAHNSQNSLDWDGVYRGVLPCADCQGIQTTLTLSKSLNYLLKTKYIGKSDSIQENSGKFSWNAEGNTVTLETGNASMPNKYFVGENILTQLDMKGNKITGELASRYILSKNNYAILEKYWKLTELNGKPIVVDSTYSKEPHIIFKDADNRIIGNGGCNSISGSFELGAMNKIAFSKMITTQMACPHMDVEIAFLKALQATDNFTINGDMLVLNKAKMAPLARFKTVYMK